MNIESWIRFVKGMYFSFFLMAIGAMLCQMFITGAELFLFAVFFSSSILGYVCALVLEMAEEKKKWPWKHFWWGLMVTLFIISLFLPKSSHSAVNSKKPEPMVLWICEEGECLFVGESDLKEIIRNAEEAFRRQQAEEFDPAVDGG